MDEPDLKQYGDAFYITTPEIILEVGNIHEQSEGISAEVRVVQAGTGVMYWAKVNLASASARTSFAKAVSARGIEPSDTLERVVWTIVKRYREAIPDRPLIAARPNSTVSWILNGLIPRGETSVFYGDGGSGKSLVALAIAVSGLTGHAVAASPVWKVAPLAKVVYLDWESQYEDHAERLYGLCSLWGEGGAPETIRYQAMTRSLTQALPGVQKLCHDADLVIVDSLGAASGPEPEGADAAIRTMTALRTLGATTRLVVAHVTKMAADARTPARPFGSAFIWNLARSAVEVKRDDTDREDGAMTVTFTQRKVNRQAKTPPRALKFAFDGDGYIAVNVDEPDYSRLSLPAKILAELTSGEKSARFLSEVTGHPVEEIRARLNEMAKRTVVVRTRTEGVGRGMNTYWGRVDTKRTGYAS